MGKKRVVVDEYVEDLLKRVGRKLSARKLDELGILGDRLELTEEEDLAYEYVMLKTDKKEQYVAYNKYFTIENREPKEIYTKMGVSKSTYFNIRKELMEGLDEYLTGKGYGYDNASNIDRQGLPDKLSVGRYVKAGRDFVFEDREEGDLYEIYGGAEGLERYRIIRVVDSLDLLKGLTDDVVEIELENLPFIEEVLEVNDYGLGLLVTVNESKYEDYMDVGFVLNEIEVAIVEYLGEEDATELLGKDLVIEFKQEG